ncbi:katanin p60 ATPase-containing subunit A-like 2 [Opisthocomus hoazin]|uniref:katanin p60 ATPase-containing subunit A-like 2 n=1 Tax=Opisthocomus hoazin TaxID=30419 RepID=UPI003F53DC2F
MKQQEQLNLEEHTERREQIGLIRQKKDTQKRLHLDSVYSNKENITFDLEFCLNSQDEMRTEARRKNLLILIFHYLMEEGCVDAANALEQEMKLSLRGFEVCDNIDLETILMENESYYFVKFQKYPKITKTLLDTVAMDIYLHNPNVKWDDVIGLDAAKRLVKEAVVYPIRYPQLFTGILSPWKGLLLYGPPGTGKKLLAKAVATECSTTFFNISAPTIVSKLRGDSEKLVRQVACMAQQWHKKIQGSSGEHEGSQQMKTELLVVMDGLAQSDDLVFVLAASNLPRELVSAMLWRLEKQILVDLPSQEARQVMIQHWLPPLSNSGGVELRTDLDYGVLGQETDGYSGSDIKLVCKEAAVRPVRKIFDALENHQPGNSNLPMIWLDTITTADFLDVITHTKPSAKNLSQKYTAWQREFESV